MNEKNQKKENLTLDEAMGIVSDIARHGEGADRFRAVRMIHDMAQESGGQLLPEPTSEAEVMERAERLFTGLGEVRCHIVMKRCFKSPMKRSVAFSRTNQPKRNRPKNVPEQATDGPDAEPS